MVQQAAAIQRVRLPVRDLRLGGERGGLAREGLRGAQVAGLGGEADGVGQQVLDLLDFFCIVAERVRQRGQRLRQRAVMLAVQAAGQRQRARSAGARAARRAGRRRRGGAAPRRSRRDGS